MSELTEFRKAKDQFMGSDEDSPLTPDQRHEFHGLNYYKHFLGPVWWLIPLIAPIEIISHLARILSLSIRLFGNIMAKETLLGILFILAGAYFAPLPILCLGVFVSIVQALVFVLLSILYFSASMEHAH